MKATKDKIADKFTKQLKASIDKKTGEELTQYPKRLKVKVPYKDGFFDCKLYDTKGNLIDAHPDKILTRGCQMKAIIQCVGLWCAASGFSCQWKLVRAEVDVPEGTGDIDFLPDTDDEDEDNLTASVEEPSKPPQIYKSRR